VEAVLLALMGGAMGVAIGVGLAQLNVGPLHPVVSPGSIVVSFIVSALVGVPLISPLEDIVSPCGREPFVYSQR
jgi:hypothetical protein